VSFDAYESDIPWLSVGDPVSFTVSSLPGETFKEKISFIDPVIDDQTRTARVRVEVRNTGGRFKPGMFANGRVSARLPIDEAHLVVPKSAVMWTGRRSVVYVAVPGVDPPTFEFREVELGPDLGGYFVVDDGLSEGDLVVTNGTFKVDAAAQLAGKRSMMNREPAPAPVSPDSVNPAMLGMAETSFHVNGNCDMCKSRIEKAARGVAGVRHAVWNKDTRMVTVHYDSSRTNPEAIGTAIARAGHDNAMQKAPPASFDSLPECCRYTRHHHP
jgi:Cu(I)/Ag(I) efflux system membrane fusion protein